ncbi:MAG: DUF4123 domain-containing protein [Polyangiaceae bacterium]|nr:DUF4123 domain-containing protein [Polyangiaceae bacterium]
MGLRARPQHGGGSLCRAVGRHGRPRARCARSTGDADRRSCARRWGAAWRWIRAGETVVSLHIEAFTPARREAHAIWSDEKRRALEALSSAEPLFAVLDAARDPRILQLLRESVHEAPSLYDGVQGDALASVAPYVVALPHASRLLQQLVLEGWGKRWGVFLSSRAPLAEVRRHLRRFLLVADDVTGRRLYFRFYDPTALRTFLSCATTRQASAFFMNIDRLLVEDDAAAVEVVEAPAV